MPGNLEDRVILEGVYSVFDLISITVMYFQKQDKEF